MNTTKKLAILGFLMLIQIAAVAAEAYANVFETMAQELSRSIVDGKKAKVAILDFTDLQGNFNELGRFVAEQLTVSLVMHRTNFSVIDRSNLKRILEEHKLSATGLVDPDNAKKLGQFAGVDVLLLGTVTPLKERILISAKIIATDTAELIGTARGEFNKTSDIADLLSPHLPVEEEVNGKTNGLVAKVSRVEIEKNSQKIDGLVLKIESLKFTEEQRDGRILATLILANTDSKSINVGISTLNNSGGMTSIVNSRGDEFKSIRLDLSGVTLVRYVNNQVLGTMTSIPPGQSIKVMIKYFTRWNYKGGDYPPYRFQLEILTADEDRGMYKNVKKQNFVIDVEMAK